jgi:hypothetical protein
MKTATNEKPMCRELRRAGERQSRERRDDIRGRERGESLNKKSGRERKQQVPMHERSRKTSEVTLKRLSFTVHQPDVDTLAEQSSNILMNA